MKSERGGSAETNRLRLYYPPNLRFLRRRFGLRCCLLRFLLGGGISCKSATLFICLQLCHSVEQPTEGLLILVVLCLHAFPKLLHLLLCLDAAGIRPPLTEDTAEVTLALSPRILCHVCLRAAKKGFDRGVVYFEGLGAVLDTSLVVLHREFHGREIGKHRQLQLPHTLLQVVLTAVLIVQNFKRLLVLLLSPLQLLPLVQVVPLRLRLFRNLKLFLPLQRPPRLTLLQLLKSYGVPHLLTARQTQFAPVTIRKVLRVNINAHDLPLLHTLYTDLDPGWQHLVTDNGLEILLLEPRARDVHDDLRFVVGLVPVFLVALFDGRLHDAPVPVLGHILSRLPIQKLHLELQRRPAGDAGWASRFSVRVLAGTRQNALFALPHCRYTKVPTLDDLTLSDGELKGFVPVPRRVELAPIGFQCPHVVHLHLGPLAGVLKPGALNEAFFLDTSVPRHVLLVTGLRVLQLPPFVGVRRVIVLVFHVLPF
eukprot:Hpha_TRINITY_DN16016_c5_g2::TRINITY_DN16016_c5_g2_i1::g.120919::m.120919